MQRFDKNQTTYYSEDLARSALNTGLRSFMISVYNNMAIGLVISAIAAYALFHFSFVLSSTGSVIGMTRLGRALFTTPLVYVIMFAPLVMIFFLSSAIKNMSVGAARTMFFLFTVLMGVSLTSVFARYTMDSITQVFLVTAASFGTLSLWGYVTRKDISGWGSFLFMGLIGLFLVSVVNIFLGSSMVQSAISCVGVLVFAGYTAYDTQNLKNLYLFGNYNQEEAARIGIYGALSLYIDFVNLFLYLLHFFGGNRD